MEREQFGNDDMVVRVAWLYYKKQLKQQEIADHLSISRSKVQRYLESAKDQQIIQFYVKKSDDNIDFKSQKDMYSKRDLISRVAWLYYIKQFNQQEISEQLSISRPKVQRFLEKARDQEIIQFFIKHPNYNIFEIEREVINKFNLKDALIVPELLDSNEEPGQSIAQAGAAYFAMTVRSLKNGIVGIGWGENVAHLVDHYISTTDLDINVVTLVGGFNGHPDFSPHLISAKLALKMNVPFSQILAPIMVGSREAAKAFREEQSIALALKTAEKASVLLVSLGTVDSSSSIITNGLIDEETYLRLKKKKVAGEILGHFFDENGEFIEDESHDRIIGVSRTVFHNPDNTIICVADASKLDAISAVLKTGLIDVLITVEDVVQKLLPADKKHLNIHKSEDELMGRGISGQDL